ncbi:MAG: SGNH/GDSL hydrolase family protein [Acidobacteriia bacterium]|nr:SGNH/GDSL hydrolase family protein [Terriglobia bacterium]
MKNSFERSAIASVAILLGLLIVIKLPASIQNTRMGRLADRVLSKIRVTNFKAEDLETLDAGYYEGLRKEGSVDPSLRFRDDFLEYDYKPNLHLSVAGLGRTTNSLGMYDREYTVEKPPHTWRIALLGDSMALGPFGHNYESLLENRLNEAQLNPDIQKFEVLNFAVGGYRITQIMETMIEKAAPFHPDVYMVAITGVGVSHRWSFHIGHLLQRKIDLKYDFLRKVVADAHVRPSDSLETMDRKLAPFTPAVFDWCLEQMKEEASKQGARMVILLIPEPVSSDLIYPQFSSARPIIEKLGVPVIDLLDTYAASKNFIELRVSRDDVHANARGHEMVFENLYRKVEQDPKLSDVVFGTGQSKGAHSGATHSLASPAAPTSP